MLEKIYREWAVQISGCLDLSQEKDPAKKKQSNWHLQNGISHISQISHALLTVHRRPSIIWTHHAGPVGARCRPSAAPPPPPSGWPAPPGSCRGGPSPSVGRSPSSPHTPHTRSPPGLTIVGGDRSIWSWGNNSRCNLSA